MANEVKTAVFGAGCFWCIQAPFDVQEGVLDTVVGYAGGAMDAPSYNAVSTGRTGHIEVVEVSYDPAIVSYQQLLDIFWRNIDPFDAKGQFSDKGSQYLSAIFVETLEEQQLAEASRAAVATQFGKEVHTLIREHAQFYPAEAYHQDYYKKHPERYKMFSIHSGRKGRLQELWGASEKR